ncbi:MAG TPA: tetratricopeptide repeat protein, partial [Blastocatellia bacterium]|nr:tetratricopeptide repeat protein [Blastocatellia bacterium]
LAAEVARALSAVFANRILWTSADGREDFSLSTLLDEIATQLGQTDLRRLALEPKKEDVRALIDDALSLIVLDNFETLSAVEQVSCANWIADAPCPALITTRLQVNGRRNVLIDAMSPEEAREFLDRLIAETSNLRDFKNLDRDSIIQSADANPLVMQWIIAQIGLAQRPDDVLDDLAHGEGDAAQRVFDRSFKLAQLSDDGRASLLALYLFAPSASRSGLAEVAGIDNDIKRLNEAIKGLAALCLVEPTDEGERLIIKGLTRELARARLYKDERSDEFRRRFVTYFLRYAEGHAATTPEDFDALESEKDNLLNAMDVASEMKDWENVMGIRSALEEFLDLRGYWNEAISRGEQAITAAQALAGKEQEAVFSANMAKIRYRQGEYDEARSLYHQAHDAFKSLGSERNIAVALHQLALIAQDQGELDEARRLYNESLEINKKLGDQSGIASTLHQLGRLAEDQGDKTEAARLFREALSIFEKLGSPDAEIARRALKRVKGESDE